MIEWNHGRTWINTDCGARYGSFMAWQAWKFHARAKPQAAPHPRLSVSIRGSNSVFGFQPQVFKIRIHLRFAAEVVFDHVQRIHRSAAGEDFLAVIHARLG